MERITAEHRAREGISSKLSMWTVVGAVAASVATAGVLGSISGILQIPQMVNDVSMLRSAKDDHATRLSGLSERVRSQELTDENLQRQLDAISQRIDVIAARVEKQTVDERTIDMQTQQALGELDTRLSRAVSEVEGRSKDRNTEAMGATKELRASVDALLDRQKTTAASLDALRSNFYDLAMRLSTRSDQLHRGSIDSSELSPSISPPSREQTVLQPESAPAMQLSRWCSFLHQR